LTRYHVSKGVAERLVSDIGPILDGLGKAPEGLPSHPSEEDIVKRALETELPRLRSELDAAHAPIVISLGNAALRVMAALLGVGDAPLLSPNLSTYGQARSVHFDEREVTWYPFAHPGAPKPYQHAHKVWFDDAPAAG
jgi:uracil-DNA glycosylase